MLSTNAFTHRLPSRARIAVDAPEWGRGVVFLLGLPPKFFPHFSIPHTL